METWSCPKCHAGGNGEDCSACHNCPYDWINNPMENQRTCVECNKAYDIAPDDDWSEVCADCTSKWYDDDEFERAAQQAGTHGSACSNRGYTYN